MATITSLPPRVRVSYPCLVYSFNVLLNCATFDIAAAQTSIPCQTRQHVGVDMYMVEVEDDALMHFTRIL